MAVIRRSTAKTKRRNNAIRRNLFYFITLVLCLGMAWGFLFTDEMFFIERPDIIFMKEDSESSLKALRLAPDSVGSLSKNKVQSMEKFDSTVRLTFPQSNVDRFRNPSVSLGKNVYMYHHTLGSTRGKEGAVVLDMLLAHAYAFHQGGIYGGSCGEGNDLGRDPENSLIRAIGLQDYLQFSCPRDLETKDRKKVLPGKSYIQDGTRIFTPEYVSLLKSVIKYPKEKDGEKKVNTIVVHMSRGKKFSPCRNGLHEGFEPYLPNKHYQLLINKYSKPDHENEVIIFSESTSFETFDEFENQGYKLHVDEAIADVWKAVMKADVFIMSRSSFSFVPALVAKDSTEIVYTPFWHHPIRGWKIVRDDVLSQSEAELNRLKATCKKNDKLEKYRRKRVGR